MTTIIKDVTAGRDIVGRDLIVTYLPPPTQIDALNEHYEEEVKTGNITQEFIDELTHYKSINSEIRSLATKLDDAGFPFMLNEAERLKELVSRLIVKNQHYRSAQKIITLILAEAESIFNCEIKPNLASGMTEADVKKLFRDKLEVKVVNMLGSNVLEIYNRQIAGVIYFLTGNCHLEWK